MGNGRLEMKMKNKELGGKMEKGKEKIPSLPFLPFLETV